MLFFKIYLPEIFLVFCLIIVLIFNTILINNLKFKTPILNFEIFTQIFTILSLLLLLLSNIESFNIGFDFFFFSSSQTQNVKIFVALNFFFFLF